MASELLFELTDSEQIKIFIKALETVGKILKKVIPTVEDDDKKKIAPDALVYNSTSLIPSRIAHFPAFIQFDFVSYLTKRGNKTLGDFVKDNGIEFCFGYNYRRHSTWLKNNAQNVKKIDVYTDKIILAIIPNRVQLVLSYNPAELDEYAETSDKIASIISDDNPPVIFIEGFQQDIVKKASTSSPIFFIFDVENQSVSIKSEVYEVKSDKPCLRVLKNMLLIPESASKYSYDIALYKDPTNDKALFAVFMTKAKDFESVQYCKFASKI